MQDISPILHAQQVLYCVDWSFCVFLFPADDKFHEGGHPICSPQHSLAGVLLRQAHLSCLINRFGVEPSLQYSPISQIPTTETGKWFSFPGAHTELGEIIQKPRIVSMNRTQIILESWQRMFNKTLAECRARVTPGSFPSHREVTPS